MHLHPILEVGMCTQSVSYRALWNICWNYWGMEGPLFFGINGCNDYIVPQELVAIFATMWRKPEIKTNAEVR